MRMRFFDRGITMRDDIVGETDPRKREPVEDEEDPNAMPSRAKQQRDVEAFQAASNARWSKALKNRPTIEPSEDDGPGPFGGNLSSKESSLKPTPGERAQRVADDSKRSPIERFVQASKERWAKKK